MFFIVLFVVWVIVVVLIVCGMVLILLLVCMCWKLLMIMVLFVFNFVLILCRLLYRWLGVIGWIVMVLFVLMKYSMWCVVLVVIVVLGMSSVWCVMWFDRYMWLNWLGFRCWFGFVMCVCWCSVLVELLRWLLMKFIVFVSDGWVLFGSVIVICCDDVLLLFVCVLCV